MNRQVEREREEGKEVELGLDWANVWALFPNLSEQIF